jgi:hypothetical protein
MPQSGGGFNSGVALLRFCTIPRSNDLLRLLVEVGQLDAATASEVDGFQIGHQGENGPTGRLVGHASAKAHLEMAEALDGGHLLEGLRRFKGPLIDELQRFEGLDLLQEIKVLGCYLL